MSPARLRWGILLVTVGLLLLLRNVGLFNDDIWIALLVYSPLVLIAIGIEKIFTRTRVQFISYMTSGFLFVGGLAIAFMAGVGGYQGSYFNETDHTIPFDPKIESMSAEVKLDCTDLTIRDSGDDLVYAEFDRFTSKPTITHTIDGRHASVKFDNHQLKFFGGALKIHTDDQLDWRIRFHEEIPLSLALFGEDTDIHLNLSTTPLQQLKLDTDDATIYLKLGELEPFVKITVDGKDSKFKLRIPQAVGLRVRGAEYRGYLERLGLVGDDGVFQTAGYDSMKTQIQLDLDNRLSSLSIDYF